MDVRNPPAALIVAHDKLLTARRSGARRPAAPAHDPPHPGLPAAVPELPVVLKPRFGSWGRDVERCATAEELDARSSGSAGSRWFLEHGALAQELVEPRGWDHAARRRRRPRRRSGVPDRPHGEWRTNAALGAQVEPVEPPPVAQALALAAARAARADLVGVDLLPTPNGGFLVLELNGAVDFRPVVRPSGTSSADAVDALLEDAVRQPELAAASV